jgi:hypothetical protein
MDILLLRCCFDVRSGLHVDHNYPLIHLLYSTLSGRSGHKCRITQLGDGVGTRWSSAFADLREVILGTITWSRNFQSCDGGLGYKRKSRLLNFVVAGERCITYPGHRRQRDDGSREWVCNTQGVVRDGVLGNLKEVLARNSGHYRCLTCFHIRFHIGASPLFAKQALLEPLHKTLSTSHDTH